MLMLSVGSDVFIPDCPPSVLILLHKHSNLVYVVKKLHVHGFKYLILLYLLFVGLRRRCVQQDDVSMMRTAENGTHHLAQSPESLPLSSPLSFPPLLASSVFTFKECSTPPG